MARNRLIYQSQLLYVSADASSTSVTDHEELTRVQSANYGFSVTRQDVNEYGQLARIDAIVLDPPTVNLDFSYYLTDGFNERALGFYVQTGSDAQGGFASGHLITSSGRNFFVTVHGEGEDGINKGTEAPDAVIGVGNAYLSDYSVDFSVGSLPTVTVSVEGSNINSDNSAFAVAGNWSGISSPGINTANGTSLGNEVILPSGIAYADEAAGKISALRPGDVTLDISAATGLLISNITGLSAVHVQSASLSVPLSRSSLTKLGTKFDYAKVVDFPVTASLNVSAIVNEFEANELVDIIDAGAVTLSLSVLDSTGGTAVTYIMKNAEIDSENFSSSIGSDNTVDMTFTTQIGSASDAVNGVFMSGKNITSVFVA